LRSPDAAYGVGVVVDDAALDDALVVGGSVGVVCTVA